MSKIIERNLPVEVGQTIRIARKSKKMSMYDLGKQAGVSASYIIRIESGERACPSVLILKKIAEVLGLDITKLISVNEGSDQTELSVLISEENLVLGGRKMLQEEKALFLEFTKWLGNTEWTKKSKAIFVVEMMQKIEQIKLSVNSNLQLWNPYENLEEKMQDIYPFGNKIDKGVE